MEQMINFTFVLHYYDDTYEYLHRVISFIDDYYEMVLEKNYIISPEKINENGSPVVELGEIVPFFLKYLDIHSFNFDDFESKEDMIRTIVGVVLDQKEYLEEDDLNTMVIRLNHIIE